MNEWSPTSVFPMLKPFLLGEAPHRAHIQCIILSCLSKTINHIFLLGIILRYCHERIIVVNRWLYGLRECIHLSHHYTVDIQLIIGFGDDNRDSSRAGAHQHTMVSSEWSCMPCHYGFAAHSSEAPPPKRQSLENEHLQYNTNQIPPILWHFCGHYICETL